MSRECSTHGEMINCVQYFSRKPEGKLFLCPNIIIPSLPFETNINMYNTIRGSDMHI